MAFRYNDVAKYGFEAIEKSDLSSAETFRQCEVLASVIMTNAERPSGLGGYFSTKSLLQNKIKKQKPSSFCSMIISG